MNLTFLGTGASMPSITRNLSSVVLNLLDENKELWMFDCGEATQHQILRSKIKLSKIKKIFITHLHGDHIYGLLGVLSSKSFQTTKTPLTVFGPIGIKKFILTSFELTSTTIPYPLDFIEFDDTSDIIFEDDKFIVEIAPLLHRCPSYGFRVTEKDRPGELNIKKLQEENILPGPIYKQIKENESTTLEDGRIIERTNYIGPNKKGKVVTVIGDTKFCDNISILSQDCDVLICEATYGHDFADKANEYMHLTTTAVANVAKQSNVKKLIITHISPRYDQNDNDMLVQECKNIFDNSYIAEDLTNFEI